MACNGTNVRHAIRNPVLTLASFLNADVGLVRFHVVDYDQLVVQLVVGVDLEQVVVLKALGRRPPDFAALKRRDSIQF